MDYRGVDYREILERFCYGDTYDPEEHDEIIDYRVNEFDEIMTDLEEGVLDEVYITCYTTIIKKGKEERFDEWSQTASEYHDILDLIKTAYKWMNSNSEGDGSRGFSMEPRKRIPS